MNELIRFLVGRNQLRKEKFLGYDFHRTKKREISRINISIKDVRNVKKMKETVRRITFMGREQIHRDKRCLERSMIACNGLAANEKEFSRKRVTAYSMVVYIDREIDR